MVIMDIKELRIKALKDWYSIEFARRSDAIKNGMGQLQWVDAGTRVSWTEVVKKAEELGLDTNPVHLSIMFHGMKIRK